MEHLLEDLPELTLLIVENLDVCSALSFSLSCRNAELCVEYLFKKRCAGSISDSFRGWKEIKENENENKNKSWLTLYQESKKIKNKIIISWSFREYTNDTCQRVIDGSVYKFHGIRTFTEITEEGQFGKAMKFPKPVQGSVQQVKGSQVQAMVSSLPFSINKFTLSFWMNIKFCETFPLLSLLFTPKFVPNTKTMMQNLNFVNVNISSSGNLFFGRTSEVSQVPLENDLWHHIIITGHPNGLTIYEWNEKRENKEYVEVLSNNKNNNKIEDKEVEKMVVMIGNGKKGEYLVEEMCMIGEEMDKNHFWWLRNGLAFA